LADSISTKNVWPYYSAENVQRAAREPVKQMGKDEFLQLLVTQFQNQDPLKPMENTEFIAQMAQFSSLEQMLNMTKEVSALKQSAGLATGLIGMKIEWVEEAKDTGGEIAVRQGIVESIRWKDGLQYAQIGDEQVAIDKVISITLPTGEQPPSGDQPEVGGNE